MDFDDTEEDAAFRREVSAWLQDHAEVRTGVADWSRNPAHLDYVRRCREWQHTLYEGGWGAIKGDGRRCFETLAEDCDLASDFAGGGNGFDKWAQARSQAESDTTGERAAIVGGPALQGHPIESSCSCLKQRVGPLGHGGEGVQRGYAAS